MRRVSEEENMSVVREELHRQANYLRTLESTNAKLTSELTVLRERQTSVEVLKEQKRGLEKRVQVLEELRTKVVKLEAEVEAGRREREDWYLLSFAFDDHRKSLHLSPGQIDPRISIHLPIHLSLLRNPSPNCV
jgi:DNA repair exonuclease SbcCD ATPase subunit